MQKGLFTVVLDIQFFITTLPSPACTPSEAILMSSFSAFTAAGHVMNTSYDAMELSADSLRKAHGR